MKLELLTTTVEDLIQKPIDIFNEVYNSLNDDSGTYDKLYEEYVKYTRDYATGSCLFRESFIKKLPNVDKLMQYITINYDSIELDQEDKWVTIYIDLNINIELFKSL